MRSGDVFAHKTVLVTGGTRGIGRILAEAFAGAGAFVEVVGRSGEALAATVEAAGAGRCAGTAADLATEEGLAAVVEAVASRHDRLDVLINNAATSRFTPIEGSEHALATWDRIFRLNVAVPFVLTVRLLPLLARSEPAVDGYGRVINIGSMDAMRVPEHDAFAYAASKAALHHLTEMLAPKLASHGVVVNALAPSAFRTRMSAERLGEGIERMAAVNPLGRLGEAADIVGVVTFLASSDNAFVNGAVIPLDGGTRLRTFPFAAMSRVLDDATFLRIVRGEP